MLDQADGGRFTIFPASGKEGAADRVCGIPDNAGHGNEALAAFNGLSGRYSVAIDMTEGPIPPDVHQFLVKHIDSIGALEALLLLRGGHGIEWTPALIAQRLYITEAAAGQLLAHLVARRLIVQDREDPPRFRYHPESEELESLVTATCEIYAKHLVPVTNLIHSKSRTRIQEFADAFKLRRKD